MITVLLGTRAQLIKMAPVMLELERRGWSYQLIMTGQHNETMAQLLADFHIRTLPEYLYEGPEVTSISRVMPWFFRCLWLLLRQSGRFFKGRGIVLVHGDTFSTLLGAVAGKFSGQKVGHVESGLRSFRIFHPFPEELTRLLVFRLTDLAFCPDDWALSNLSEYTLTSIDTGGNTLMDALRLAIADRKLLPALPSEDKFGVVSLHRFENIFQREKLLSILGLLEHVAEAYPLVFVLHPATKRNLEKFELYQRLASNSSFCLWPRMGYFEFVSLLQSSTFVITDGGSNQEELSYLDKPTFLMREATERREGLGGNVVIGGVKREVLDEFLGSLGSRSAKAECSLSGCPSARIVDALSEFV